MLNAVEYFSHLISENKNGKAESICSICSSNSYVISAALDEGLRTGRPVLIEATANQVNQYGGYTGMRPADFAAYVKDEAKKVGFDEDMLILGGDHLGPLVWSNEPEASAMRKAVELVTEFASAGFQKIHLDCSMRLADDDINSALTVETVARRAALLAGAVEANATIKPVYIIGSEVPIPGGATEAENGLDVTHPEDLTKEYNAFKKAFFDAGLSDAWSRVIGVVVQPGVEFGDNQVFLYDRGKAKDLIDTAKRFSGIILEGHSTDYQPTECLNNMREDGIAILKVGPALTFAAREAIFALEKIEKALYTSEPEAGYSDFENILETIMLELPSNWIKHYHGNENELVLMRRYSLSDRSRYYMENPQVKAAITRLEKNINSCTIPIGLLHQYLPSVAETVIAGKIGKDTASIIKENVCNCIRTYY